MAKKATDGGGTLGDIAESLGTLLGSAEKQWRAWQGPRDAVIKAVTDVRDRASVLLAEMRADVAKGYEKTKAGKKKDGKKGRKAEKADKAGKAAKAGKPAKADKKSRKKDEKKAGKAGKKKKGKKAKAAVTAEATPLIAPPPPEV